MNIKIGLVRGILLMIPFVSVTAFSTMPASAAETVNVKEADIFVIPAPVARVIRVVDVMTIENSSADAQNFQLTLPAGASDVSFNDVSAQEHVKNGQLIEDRLLKQGETTVTVSYRLPNALDQGQMVNLHTDYPIYTAKLYIPIDGTALSAEDLLTTTQTVDVQGTQFRVFTRLGIPAGDDWGLSLRSLPVGNTQDPTAGMKVIGMSSSNAGNMLQAIANLAMAAIILVVGLISIRSTQWGRGSRVPKTPEDALLDAWQIAELQYSEGLLDKSTFERRRDECKRKLLELKRR